MSTQETISKKEQYIFWQIFGVWLTASAPMWLLSWGAFLARRTGFAGGLRPGDQIQGQADLPGAGGEKPASALQEKLGEAGLKQVTYPTLHESIEI